MKLITKEIEKKLLKNNEMHEKFRKPYLKLFSPVGSSTWLISEIESGSIEQGNAIFFGPVSYTHLTLPTKRIV